MSIIGSRTCRFFVLIQSIVLFIWIPVAQADVAYNLTVDPKALSLGNAVVADREPGIKAIHYNPAGLTKLKGRQFEAALINAYLDLDMNFVAPEEYEIFGLDGRERDPVVGADGYGRSHTNQLAFFIPGIGIQQAPINGPGVIPSNGFSFNAPGSKFTFASMTYLPFAGAWFKDSKNWGKYLAKESAIQRLTYVSPSVGYKVNDEWSVGFGVHVSHQGFGIAQINRAPNMLIGIGEIVQDAFSCEFDKPIGQRGDPLQPFISLCQGNIGPWDDIGRLDMVMQETASTTYNLGVLWEPTDWFSWGASYASEDDMKLKGQFVLDYTDEFSAFWQGFNGSIIGAITAAILSLPSGVPREAGNVSMDLTYPQHFQTGVSIRLNPKITVNIDAGWTDWSKWDKLTFRFDRSLEFLRAARILSPDNVTETSLTLPIGLKDVWTFGIGISDQITSRLQLRNGIQWRHSPVPADKFGPVPMASAIMYSGGFGYQWDKRTMLTTNISYMQAIQNTPAGSSTNLNDDSLTNLVYNPYAGLDVKTSLRFIAMGISFRREF